MSMERSTVWLRQEGASDDERRHALSHELGVPFVTLSPETIALDALLLIPEPLSREYNAVAYKMAEHTLEVALLDLADLEHLGFLESQYRLVPRLTSRASMVKALLHYQRYLRQTYGAALEKSDSPNLLDTLLRHALMSQASDIHLESGEGGLLVRYRIRGTLKEAFVLPAAAKIIFARLRSLAGLPPAPPQGGLPHESRLRVDLGSGEDVGVHVASMPTVAGEKMLLHLVRERARHGWTLNALGLHGEALERLHSVLHRRRGLIAVEGAAGSGKTTLLYTLLDLLNLPELSIATVEARIEHELPRAAQVEPSALLSAAAALRGVLKTDPDVVTIDPIESREVAVLAAAAAARGVLVLTSSVGGFFETFPPTGGLRIRTAVVRKLCDKQFLDKRKLTRAQLDALEAAGADFARVLAALKGEERVDKESAWKELQFARAQGCSECEGGYKGTIGIQAVEEIPAQGGSTSGQGLNVVEDALFKAAQGLTSIDEVLKLAV